MRFIRSAGRTVAGTTVAVLGLACGDGRDQPETFAVRDSAGVEIVTSTAPAWPEGTGWVVGPDPDVVIGRTEGDERYLLSDVRAVRKLPDGRIAVLDAGSGRVRVYGANSVWDRDIGTLGTEPGEFRSPLFIDVIANSLVVYESLPPRVTRYDLEGNLMGVAEFATGPGGVGSRAMLLGTVEPRWLVGREPAPDRPFSEGVNRIPVRLIRYDLRELRAEPLATAPGEEVNVTFPSPGVVAQMVHLFGHTTYVAASGPAIFVGSTDDYSIHVHDVEGTLVRIVRRPMPARSTSDELRERFVRERMAQFDLSEAQQEVWRADLDETTMSETLPAFRFLTADESGNLWVEAWSNVGLTQGQFSIFDPDGVWLGDVSVPDGLIGGRGGLWQPSFDIGADYFLGIWEDEQGVQQVRSYPIAKPQPR